MSDRPGWVVRILLLSVPAELRDSVLGDLDEEVPPGRPRGWRLMQVARISVRFAGARVKDAAVERAAAIRRPAARGERPGHSLSARVGGGMGGFMQDLRFAIRTLVRRPAFSVAALAILTLGIGGNTTMFAVVEQVLLTPLPFEEPNDLVRVYERRPRSGRERNVAAFPDLADC